MRALPNAEAHHLASLDGVSAAESGTGNEYSLRRAVADDAQAIGAVFDAAVRGSWTFLGEIAQQPMFSAQDWDRGRPHARRHRLHRRPHRSGLEEVANRSTAV